MPYYRHKIIENNKTYIPLKCHEYGSIPPKYTWHKSLCVDLAFQAKDIERQYQLCTSSEKRWNNQLAAFLYLTLSIIWVVYFIIGYVCSESTHKAINEYSLYAAAASTSAFVGLLVISFTIGFHHWAMLSSVFVLIIGYIGPFMLLYFNANVVHRAQIACVWCCPLIIGYLLINLPMMFLVFCGFTYSAILLLYTELTAASSVMECIWLSATLLCVNIICICSRVYEELSSRKVFYRIGRSLIYRQQALEETLLKEVMIKSIMPPGVCNQILNSGMLHDVVLCRDPESNMRNLPIKLMKHVSILFADLVGFTAMSSTLEASDLVTLLTDLYGRFDCVAEAYNCENISILGDCYFAVSGCPEPDERHADNCMYTGVGLIKATQEFCVQMNKSIDIRVGIHTGIVLCGIVGGTKFKYDVWSSDAKLANYMESGGVPGRVHTSEQTTKCLKDHWEFEEGFGSKRESELQGIRTYLLKSDFQKSVIIEPKKRDVSESIVYKTIEKKRGSSITSKEFDGSILLQHVISNEELLRGYTLLPILHPGLTLDDTKSPNSEMNGNSSYNAMTSATPLGNGMSSPKPSTPEKPQTKQLNSESLLTARRPWNIHRAFGKVYADEESGEKTGCRLMLNPLTGSFRSSRVRTDYQNHGWSNEGCVCLFSHGYLSVAHGILYLIASAILVILLTSVKSQTYLIIVEVFVNIMILMVGVVMFIRWKRAHRLLILQRIHHVPYSYITIVVVVLLMLSTFVVFIFIDYSTATFDEIQYLTLPVIVLLTHFLLYDKTYIMVQILLLLISFGGLVGVDMWCSMLPADAKNVNGKRAYFGVMGATCMGVVVLALIWVKTIKSKLRFGTLHESNTELAIMKEEEKVTTQLFNTIIPKHVSDKFLRELRYSHSYQNVGVIFAEVTNFWDFYEEKFEGGMGCIRILNEIIRDLDDMLSSVNDIRHSDPRWRAIQKIKTVGSCYMAASGLDPVTEEQTKQGNHEHIIHLMEFSFKILDTIKQFNVSTFGTEFTMKIGFTYGPVTDGIIGQNKVLYDIWGDTVNLSSRMMSTGVVGRIQLPAACTLHLIDHFKCPRRGKVAVKGKGDMITHFCIGIYSPEQIKTNLDARAAENMNSTEA